MPTWSTMPTRRPSCVSKQTKEWFTFWTEPPWGPQWPVKPLEAMLVVHVVHVADPINIQITQIGLGFFLSIIFYSYF